MFYLLQTNPSNKTVEIIKAIGSTWPFLLVIFLIIFFLVYSKKLANHFSKYNKISSKTPVGEFSIEKKSAPEKLNENSESQDIQSEIKVPESNKEPEKKEDEGVSKMSFFEIYEELKKGELKKAETIFAEIQRNKKNDEEGEINSLYFLYLKYLYANTNYDVPQSQDSFVSSLR